jgi:hypothetical protein
MRLPAVDDTVRLTQDIPELMLMRGMTGVIRSTWCAPWVAYEVEFRVDGLGHETRALLMAEQVEVDYHIDDRIEEAAVAGPAW